MTELTERAGLRHRQLEVNGVSLHVVEMGVGPAVVLCHGFPELWYSWRHQLPALARAGYRAIALDMRGHGGSSAPSDVAAYDVSQTVGDVIAVLDHLDIATAAIVGHDAGTSTAYHAALMRPDRIRGVLGLSVPYLPRGPMSVLEAFDGAVPDGFYMQYFQEPGRAERDLERDVAVSLRRIFYANSGHNAQVPYVMTVPPGGNLVDELPDPEGPLDFLSDEDLKVYADAYAASGFRGGLNGYRVLHRNWQLSAPWNGMALPVPSAYLGGTSDTVLHFPGFRDAAEAMDEATFAEGAGHWIQAERPNLVNAVLLAFLARIGLEGSHP